MDLLNVAVAAVYVACGIDLAILAARRRDARTAAWAALVLFGAGAVLLSA